MNRNTQSGTSLLEMLISLAIMAMIAVMLGSLMSGTAKFLGRATIVGQRVDQIIARDQLRAYLEGALLSPFPMDNRPLFQGNTQSIIFLSTEVQGMFWPGAAVEIQLGRSENGGPILLRAQGPKAADQPPQTASNTLTTSNATLTIAYFGQVVLDAPPAWRSDWQAGWAPPKLVRITLSDEKGTLPPLVIQPAKRLLQSEISASSLLPPATPSRP
jgi:hypothetical protein